MTLFSTTKSRHATQFAEPRKPIWRRANPRVLVLLVIFLAAWQVASLFAKDYIVPKIPQVASDLWQIVTTSQGLTNLLTTLGRVAVGLVSAFVVGVVIGLMTGASAKAAAYLLPAVRFIQGIPSLSWVVIAVIWFQGVELRVWFVIILVTLPGFVLQTYDSYRAVPAELRDMGRSFRPGKWGSPDASVGGLSAS